MLKSEFETEIPVDAYSTTRYFHVPPPVLLNKIPLQSPKLGEALLEVKRIESVEVPLAIKVPSRVKSTPLLKLMTTPGSMVRVSPAGTEIFPVAVKGLSTTLRVSWLPETRTPLILPANKLLENKIKTRMKKVLSLELKIISSAVFICRVHLRYFFPRIHFYNCTPT